MDRLAVRLTPAGLAAVRSGHPWVFDRSIRSVRPDGAPGDLGVIFDDRRRFVGIGLWDPESPIRLRVLHTGDPRPIDTGFWVDTVTAAARRRDHLVARRTGLRLVHGENDGLGGLVVDRYDDWAVIKLYSAALIPHLDDITTAVLAACSVTGIVVRLARHVARRHPGLDGTSRHGGLPTGPVAFTEHGCTFEADLVRGPKTGHFLDQADNRRRVGQAAAGARMLDVFSSTGGFATHAAANGARAVTLVDVSAPALNVARRHLALNAGPLSVRTRVGDAFAALESDTDRYELVVVDPPSFTTDAASVDRARRAYGRLIELALDRVAPGGLLVQASCSARISPEELVGLVETGLTRSGRSAQLEVTGQADDHPVGFPEGRYLSAVFARLEA